jgi:hypothetical protein
MIEETVPAHLLEKGFGASTSVFINLAFFIALLASGGMPEEQKDLAETKYWMVIFGIQIPFSVVIIILHQFVFKEDSIDFCVKNGDRLQAIKLISRVYSLESNEVHEQIYQEKWD